MSISLGIADFAIKGPDCDIQLHIGTCIPPVRVYCTDCSLSDGELVQFPVDDMTWVGMEGQWNKIFDHIKEHKKNGDKIPWYVDDILTWYYWRERLETDIDGSFGGLLMTLSKTAPDDIKDLINRNIRLYNEKMPLDCQLEEIDD